MTKHQNTDKGPVRLTVAIPTFNRKESVAGQIEEVNRQLAEMPLCERGLCNIELLISENPTGEGSLHELSNLSPWTLKVNAVNYGGNHNFIESVVKSSGDFVWILGDDDQLAPDALKRVVGYILGESHFSCAVFLEVANSPEIWRPASQAELFEALPAFGPLIHISKFVVRRSTFNVFAGDSTLYQGTFFPQFVYLLNCLKCSEFGIINFGLIKKGRASGPQSRKHLYSVGPFAAIGLKTLEIFIERNSLRSWRKLVKRTRTSWLSPKGVIYELAKLRLSGSQNVRHIFQLGHGRHHLSIFLFYFYWIVGNVALSSIFASRQYVKIYEKLRGYGIEFRPVLMFLDNTK